MFDCLNSIKVPSGYSSNIKRLLNLKEKKFAVEVDTSILLTEEEAPYARHDHNEGTIVKRIIVNIPLVE